MSFLELRHLNKFQSDINRITVIRAYDVRGTRRLTYTCMAYGLGWVVYSGSQRNAKVDYSCGVTNKEEKHLSLENVTTSEIK